VFPRSEVIYYELIDVEIVLNHISRTYFTIRSNGLRKYPILKREIIIFIPYSIVNLSVILGYIVLAYSLMTFPPVSYVCSPALQIACK